MSQCEPGKCDCDADRRNRRALHTLRVMVGNGCIDWTMLTAILEGRD